MDRRPLIALFDLWNLSLVQVLFHLYHLGSSHVFLNVFGRTIKLTPLINCVLQFHQVIVADVDCVSLVVLLVLSVTLPRLLGIKTPP